MSEYQEMLNSAVEELKERLQDSPNDDESDIISEIADSHTPIYYYDILQMAAENMFLALNEPDIGPAFDGSPTPINIIAANIYEAIEQELWDKLEDIKEEIEEERKTGECSTCGEEFPKEELEELVIGKQVFYDCKNCIEEDEA